MSCRRLLLAAAFLCALLLVGAGGASAATTIGDPTLNSAGSNAAFCNTARCLSYQEYPPTGSTTWASPSAGVVVRWRIVFGAVGGTGGARLRVLHPDGPGAFRAAGTSGEEVPPAPGEYQFATRLPISKTDTIAVDLPAGSQLKIALDNTNDARFGNVTPTPADNTVFNTGYPLDDELQLNADVEPDTDRDGFGDETQDKCPTDPSTQGACPLVTDLVAPSFTSKPSASPSTFVADPKGSAEIPVAGVTKGTTFRYALSEAATTTFRIERKLPGRRAHKKCGRPTRKNRKRSHCTRYKRVGAFEYKGSAGSNRKHFSGRIGKKKLRPGRYRAVLIARDAAGNRSAARTVGLKVIKAKRPRR